MQTRAVRDGDGWIIAGRKWFTTGAMHARILIVAAVTRPDGPRHRRVSLLLVPAGTAGVTIIRSLPIFGHISGPGECEIRFDDVRVPASSLLGEEGAGFAAVQARLGPGRIHHCMRAVGMADRAVELMCRRAASRVVGTGPLADKQMIQDWIEGPTS